MQFLHWLAEQKWLQWIFRKVHHGIVELRYLLGDDRPARHYLQEYRHTATHSPVPGALGELVGHGSQTVVAQVQLAHPCPPGHIWHSGDLVVKFEIYPGSISAQRFAAEYKNACLARTYLNTFMPTTLRVIGHGLRDEPGVLTYQRRVNGKRLRDVAWAELRRHPILCRELVRFCDIVLKMAQETGQVPDLCGTLPRVDFISNIFWLSRNILADLGADQVWLVDTGWKPGEECLSGGSPRTILRTRFRLATMRLFRSMLVHWLEQIDSRPPSSIWVQTGPNLVTQTSQQLSIIIVNWNTHDLLKQCLQSILADTQPLQQSNIETFVIDNASSDGSASMVREQFPWVHLIENDRNVGFARANNQAIRQSQGRYVLLLNSDTRVCPGALKALVDFTESRPAAGAVGARLLNTDGSLQYSCSPMLTPELEFRRLVFVGSIWPQASYDMWRWDITTPRRVQVIKGACLLIRTAALAQVGLLDESYFMYSEEVDLCYRLAQAGWELWWVPQATVFHYGEASSRRAAEAMYVQLYHSKVQFYRKFGGEQRANRFKRLVQIAYWPRWALAAAGAPVSTLLAGRAHTYRRLLTELHSM